MGRGVDERRLVRVDDGRRSVRFDTLAVEEPMEIRVGGGPLYVTMRTPGHDFELAAGFLVGEGLICDGGDIARIDYCAGDPQEYNIVSVEFAAGVPAPSPSGGRNFAATASCGLCGKSSIDDVRTRLRHGVADDPLAMQADLLAALPDRLRAAQRVFEQTGGLHAAGLFSEDGELLCVREDVGRHNAFDKVIGWAALAGRLPLRSHVMLASGRASFELTQKALMAGVPMIAAVSAPSSLAVELAAGAGMTLVGFLRGSTMNVYTGEGRVL